jgi:hypothetical protein
MVASSRTDPAGTFVPAFGWSRARTALVVDGLLQRLPADDPQRRALQARARAAVRECGCKLGGLFLGGALLLTPVYVIATRDFSIWSGVRSVAFVFGAAVAGKLIGLALAWARLVLLHRTLLRTLR